MKLDLSESRAGGRRRRRHRGFAEAVLATLARGDLAALGARAQVLASYVCEANLAGFDVPRTRVA